MTIRASRRPDRHPLDRLFDEAFQSTLEPRKALLSYRSVLARPGPIDFPLRCLCRLVPVACWNVVT